MLGGNLPRSYTTIPSQNIQMCCYKHIHKSCRFYTRVLLRREPGVCRGKTSAHEALLAAWYLELS